MCCSCSRLRLGLCALLLSPFVLRRLWAWIHYKVKKCYHLEDCDCLVGQSCTCSTHGPEYMYLGVCTLVQDRHPVCLGKRLDWVDPGEQTMCDRGYLLSRLAVKKSPWRLRLERLLLGDHIGPIVASMREDPLNEQVQIDGCGKLTWHIKRRWPLQQWETLAHLEVLVSALASDNKRVAAACASSLGEMVHNHHSLAAIVNMTGAYKEMMGILRKWPDDIDVHRAVLPELGRIISNTHPELTPYAQHLGVFDVLFGSAEKWPSDGPVQLAVLKGLYYHSLNPVGAGIIANNGGLDKGIEYLLRFLHAPENYSGVDESMLLYYTQGIFNGLLMANTERYGTILLEAGLAQRTVRAMQSQAEPGPLARTSCANMNILVKDRRNQAAFIEAGALKELHRTIKRMVPEELQALVKQFPHFPPHQWHMLIRPSQCIEAVKSLAINNSAVKETLVKDGLYETLVSFDFYKEKGRLVEELLQTKLRLAA